MAVRGRKPLVGFGGEVEEYFIHCAKSIKRSKLWEPGSWAGETVLPSAAQVLFAHANLPDTSADSIQGRLEEGYAKRLY